MTGKIYPEDANVSYNERNNSVRWEIGNISAATGILSGPREATFQVKIKPSPDQVGKTADILGPSNFTAKDLFTGQDLSAGFEKKTTELREDASVGYNYMVAK